MWSALPMCGLELAGGDDQAGGNKQDAGDDHRHGAEDCSGLPMRAIGCVGGRYRRSVSVQSLHECLLGVLAHTYTLSAHLGYWLAL